ncbi:MAG TPA: SPOR domain-containing protein, partial [bacterium]|nr:SPOR domain-containing protein [bacterium]
PESTGPASGDSTLSPADPTAGGSGAAVAPAETTGAGRSPDLNTATTQAAPASAPPAAATADQRPAISAPVPALPTPAAVPPTYRVQVGAFRRQINVDEVVLRLRADGYRPVVRRAGDLQIVSVGSFTSRAAAQRLAAELRAKRYDALVVP